VRGIERIDEQARQIWFEAGGRNPDQDPYFVHFYSVNFDGSGLVALTEGDGNIRSSSLPTRRFLIDTYSRVDMAPVHTLRRASDGSLICDLEKRTSAKLIAGGWTAPDAGHRSPEGVRDGAPTDIWGTSAGPMNFDPAGKYPVIEQIYAGPQSAGTCPRDFSPFNRFSSRTDLGFNRRAEGWIIMGLPIAPRPFTTPAGRTQGRRFPDRISVAPGGAAMREVCVL
jgi:hypothetical protein